MAGELINFGSLPTGAIFFCNGNRCIKRSSRTADLVDWGRTFYFGRTETVAIGWPGEEA
jgi:hypothetical protein